MDLELQLPLMLLLTLSSLVSELPFFKHMDRQELVTKIFQIGTKLFIQTS